MLNNRVFASEDMALTQQDRVFKSKMRSLKIRGLKLLKQGCLRWMMPVESYSQRPSTPGEKHVQFMLSPLDLPEAVVRPVSAPEKKRQALTTPPISIYLQRIQRHPTRKVPTLFQPAAFSHRVQHCATTPKVPSLKLPLSLSLQSFVASRLHQALAQAVQLPESSALLIDEEIALRTRR